MTTEKIRVAQQLQEEEAEELEASRRQQEREEAEERLRKIKEAEKFRKLDKATFDNGNWPLPEKYKNKHTISMKDIVDVGLPRKELAQYINQEIGESESCRSLPFALLLLGIYANSALAHENAQTTFNEMRSMQELIYNRGSWAYTSAAHGHKNLKNVDTPVDFWSWLSLGFVPTIWNQMNEVSEQSFAVSTAYEDNQKGMLLNFNRLIGGIRLRFVDSELPDGGACPTVFKLHAIYGHECVGGLGNEMDPEKWEAWEFPDAESGITVTTRWFLAHESINDIQEIVKTMEYSGMLSNVTSRIEISLPVYNGESGVYVLTKINFYFSRAGRIWKDVSSATVFADWWPKTSYMVVDIVFLACIASIVFSELLELRQSIRQHGFRRFWRYYINFWNMVDWFSVLSGLAITLLMRINYSYTNKLNSIAADLGALYTNSVPNVGAAIEPATIDVMEWLEKTIRYNKIFRFVLAVYPLVIVFKFSKAFSAQARLAVFANTIVKAAMDLVHFMIVYVSVFFAYVLSGLALFGRTSDEFVSLTRTSNALFRNLVGKFDWNDLRRAGNWETFLFFAFFQMQMTYVLWNLLLSMLISSYNAVKKDVFGAEMIWDELKQELNQRFGKTTLVPYWKIRAGLQYDEKVDTLKRIDVKPRANTTYVEVTMGLGKLTITCFKQYPRMEKLGTLTEKAVGDVVFCDGLGDTIEVLAGATEDFPVKLDEHHAIHFYFDSTGGRQDGMTLLHAAKEAEQGLSALGMVNTPYLERSVEGMTTEQAGEIIEDAVMDFYDRHYTRPDDSDLRSLILHLEHRIEKCFRAVTGERKPAKNQEEELISVQKDDEEPLSQVDQLLRKYRNSEKKSHKTLVVEIANCMALVQEHTLDTRKKYEAMCPADERDRDLTDSGYEQSAEYDQLDVDMDVKILTNMRRIISSCFDCGLSVENSQIRKECAGLHAKVLEKDPYDETVCLSIAGIGKMWFAPAAVQSPEGQAPWGPPTEVEMARREEDKQNKEQYYADLGEAKTLAQRKRLDLETTRAKLKKELEEMMPIVQEASDAKGELINRIERQRDAKTRAEQGVKIMEEKLAKVVEAARSTQVESVTDQNVLHMASLNRNEYFDTMREMIAENQRIRLKLEEEQAKLSEQHAQNAIQSEDSLMYDADIKGVVEELQATRELDREVEERDIARVVGYADASVRSLEQSRLSPAAIPHLLKVRDVALEAWQILQTL